MLQVSTTKSPPFFKAFVLRGKKTIRQVFPKKTAGPEKRSEDKDRRHVEVVELGAELTHAVGEMIPVAGGLVKGAAEALASAVKRTKQSIQNRDDVKDLIKKIGLYEKHILQHRIVEEDEDGWRAELEKSFAMIKERLDQCDSYILPFTDAQLISECSKNIDEYIKFFNMRLGSSTNNEVHQVAKRLDVFREEVFGRLDEHGKICLWKSNSVILVDMFGRQHPFAFPQALSRKQFVRLSTALYPQSREATLIQRRVAEDMFDFCIDGGEMGTAVLQDYDWAKSVQPGSKVVMRAKFLVETSGARKGLCLTCGRKSQRSWSNITCTCGTRFQTSAELRIIDRKITDMNDEEKKAIKNIHVLYEPEYLGWDDMFPQCPNEIAQWLGRDPIVW